MQSCRRLMKRRKVVRPIVQEIAKGGGKRAYALHLAERTVLVMETDEPPCTKFQFALNGYVHDVVRGQLFERPGRAASELIARISNTQIAPVKDAGRDNDAPDTGASANEDH